MLTVRNRALTSLEVERLRDVAFTYDEVGCTRGDTPPKGYAYVRRTLHIGSGRKRFDEASRVLLGWDVPRRAGLSVRASTERVSEGAVAVMRLGFGAVGINAPVRVLYVVDEPGRTGLAYGTLPGHPVSGEESFVLELADDGVVSFTVTAVSRPATALARLGGPIGRGVQSWAMNRYLRAV